MQPIRQVNDMADSMRDYLVHIAAQLDGVQEALTALQQLSRQMTGINNGAKRGTSYFGKFGGQVKGAAREMSGFARQFAKQLMGFASLAAIAMKAGKAIRTLVKDTVSLSDNLEKTAKDLGKTAEQARLHNIALASMGKTMDEINKDDKLKKTYDDLIKLGEGFQFKRAKGGITTIEDLNTELTKIKYTIRLGFSQAYEYFKVYAEKPLNQLRGWITSLIPSVSNGLDGLSKTIGKGVAKALKLVMEVGQSAVKVGKQIFDWFKRLLGFFDDIIPKSKEGSAGIVAAIGLIVLALSPLLFVIIAVWLLIDDFVAWSEGRASAFGDAWYTAFDILQGAYAVISVAGKIIYDAVVAIHNFIADLASVANAIGLDVGTVGRWDYVNPFDYENDAIYKAFEDAKTKQQKTQEERQANSDRASELEKSKANGGTLSQEDSDWLQNYYVSQGRNPDGTNRPTQNMSGDQIMEYYFGGSGNNYPAYAQGGTEVNETTNKETQVTINSNYVINQTDPSGAAAAANQNLASDLQHTLESPQQ